MFLEEKNLDMYKIEEIDSSKFKKEQVESAIKLHEDLRSELKGTIISYLIGLVIAVLKKLVNHLEKNNEAGKDPSKRNK